jgi:transcriptional regulator
VPTWNYSVVLISGRATVHDDPDWVRGAVEELTERHEGHRAARWRLTDAPEAYIDGQLRAIVGVEVSVERVEAKAKLSQNRDAADTAGVLAGLDASDGRGAAAIAAAMRRPVTLGGERRAT